MPIHGKITHWNRQKAYGFITPATGENVFVHIRAFVDHGHQPEIDQRVTFEMSTDRQGRPCAASVRLLGAKSPGARVRGIARFYIAVAVGFLAVVLGSVLFGPLPLLVLWFYLAISAISFFLYAWDKNSAQREAWRTKESTLHLFDLLGGWPGAMIAQQTLRHKSKKKEFRFVFWLTAIINCAGFGWLFTEPGQAILNHLLNQIAEL